MESLRLFVRDLNNWKFGVERKTSAVSSFKSFAGSSFLSLVSLGMNVQIIKIFWASATGQSMGAHWTNTFGSCQSSKQKPGRGADHRLLSDGHETKV